MTNVLVHGALNVDGKQTITISTVDKRGRSPEFWSNSVGFYKRIIPQLTTYTCIAYEISPMKERGNLPNRPFNEIGLWPMGNDQGLALWLSHVRRVKRKIHYCNAFNKYWSSFSL